MNRELAAAIALTLMFGNALPMVAQSDTVGRVIAYRHHHLNVTSIEDHQRFWSQALGGVPDKTGGTDNVKFPGVVVRLRQQRPTGGTKGSTVNHVGFQVPDLRRALDRINAAGFPIVTKAEVTSSQDITDDIAYIANQDAYVAYVMGPDDIKVELFENIRLTTPIALHHIHFAAERVDAMKAWYVKVFNATPSRRGSFETAELPYVSLRWAPSPSPVAPTEGRVVDHIGFEVKNLEMLSRQLVAAGVSVDRPYFKVPEFGLAVMYITDPWGTLIELTEELDKFQ